jgi:hypothetical protein
MLDAKAQRYKEAQREKSLRPFAPLQLGVEMSELC